MCKSLSFLKVTCVIIDLKISVSTYSFYPSESGLVISHFTSTVQHKNPTICIRVLNIQRMGIPSLEIGIIRVYKRAWLNIAKAAYDLVGISNTQNVFSYIIRVTWNHKTRKVNHKLPYQLLHYWR